MPMQRPDKPLSEAELERLEGILEPEDGRNVMPIEAVDGLFACLMCSPKLAMPSEWMPLVLSDDRPAPRSHQEAEEVIGLVMRLYNDVARAMNAGRYGPMITILESDKGDELMFGKDWALGFIAGINLHQEYWLDIDTHPIGDLLEPIVELARDGDEGVGLLNRKRRKKLIRELPEVVQELRDYWREAYPPGTLPPGGSGAEGHPAPPPGYPGQTSGYPDHPPGPAHRSEPIRSAPTPGRNNPCPCGSGKKYKKCCGDNTSEHDTPPQRAKRQGAKPPQPKPPQPKPQRAKPRGAKPERAKPKPTKPLRTKPRPVPDTIPYITAPAKRIWERIDPQMRVRILNNVFCGSCGGNCSMELSEGRVQRGDLVLRGCCTKCGGNVARLVESW